MPSLSSLQANKTPLRPLDPTKLQGINCGPDFIPSFANVGRPALSNRGPPRGGPGGELPRGPVSGTGERGGWSRVVGGWLLCLLGRRRIFALVMCGGGVTDCAD